MKIIANISMLKLFKTIDIFTLDLGTKDRFSDIFIKQYYIKKKENLFKFGNIGTIEFYENKNIYTDQILILLSDEREFEFKYSEDDKKIDIKEYLQTIIKSVEDFLEEEKETEKRIQLEKSKGLWENTDPDAAMKGNKKYYEIRQDVDRDEYAKLMLEKKKKKN